jgi:Na+-translocating ferredoxin:NAD+ oxidoreductase RNF subunit RnfB
MTEEKVVKQKIRQIYDVLPKVDDQCCGYRTCGEFARAVAEGRAPCDGCVTGGPGVAAEVCRIMGKNIPQQQAGPSRAGPGTPQTILSAWRRKLGQLRSAQRGRRAAIRRRRRRRGWH